LARTRPGEWLRMPGDYSASTATHIRRSVYAHLRGEKWEARSAAAETQGRHHIWIRYMGPADAEGGEA
jgi:hypothetical protein